MNTIKQSLIDTLKHNGADLVGFANIERFESDHSAEKIRAIWPEVRTVIGIAFRVLRGSHRGIEEGSTYYQYTTTGVETLEETIMPLAMLKGCAVIEEAGFLALPQRRNQMIMNTCNEVNPEIDYHEIYPNCVAENQFDFDAVAIRCGLGERGFYGKLLTKEFGPLQRVCFILTDAIIEETPLATPTLCDNCQKCVKSCPGNAIKSDGTINQWQCATYYKGANQSKNPFMNEEAFADDPDRLAILAGKIELSPERAREILDQLVFYPPIKHGYVPSICGRACDMACYIHLEERGVLSKKFKTPYRKRPEWYF